MIQYIKGDILEKVKEGIIVHGVNCQGVMGSGIALQIKEKYPWAFKTYKEYIDDAYYGNEKKYKSSDMLGKICISSYKDSKLIIINLFSQDYFGKNKNKYASYDAIDDGMHNISHWMYRYSIKKISMPKLGAGLGGGNWNVIEKIIEHRLKNFDVDVYVLE